jgi:hypothetical protein
MAEVMLRRPALLETSGALAKAGRLNAVKGDGKPGHGCLSRGQ